MTPDLRSLSMGASQTPDGATFRTWAPNAHAAYLLTGASLAAMGGPGWTPPDAARLAPVGDGTWAGIRPGLRDGDAYMVWIDGPGGSGPKRDPYARELTLVPPFPQSYCVLRDTAAYPWHDAGWRPPEFRDLVIYQLHVGTWWAGDAAGQDVRASRGGTFLDVAGKLGHLRALGINAVQLLPIQEFVTRFSMGYNGTDYFSPEGDYIVGDPAELQRHFQAVNAMLGTFGKPALASPAVLAPAVAQLQCLVDLCHLHGIAVIFDLVYNHAGGGFDPASLWFYDRQPDGDNNRSLYFTDQGWAGGEIFAYWNPWVRQFLIDNAIYLMRTYGIDGIRYDEVRVIENNGGRGFCQDLAATVRYLRPGAIQIAEYWNDDRPQAVRAAPAGLGFDSELDDRLRDALRTVLRQAAAGAGAALALSDVAAAVEPRDGILGGWRLVTCLENQDIAYAGHDGAARVPQLADGSAPRSWYARSRSRVATALLMAAPGIPMLFMGQEFLAANDWSDDRLRPGTLIDWAGLQGADAAMRDFLRFTGDLVHLRRQRPALRSDSVRVSRVDAAGRVIVLHRWLDGQGGDIVVVASLDEQPKHGYTIGLPLAGRWQELLNSDVYDGFPNPAPVGNAGSVQAGGAAMDGFQHSAALTLPANGVLVLGVG